MKILVIQSARLGDIYQTWPVLRALRRLYPEANIHLLVRARFVEACEGLDEVNCVWSVDAKELLGPLINNIPDIKESLSKMNELCEALSREKFDRIINLSFSGFSSYLSYRVAHSFSNVVGYSRYEDGSLSVEDDPSAYFFAQVGVGGGNRLHLTELFATVAEVDLSSSDWRPPRKMGVFSKPLKLPFAVVHIGASEAVKRYPIHQWRNALKTLIDRTHANLVFIGAKSELQDVIALSTGLPQDRVTVLAGETRLIDLFSVISSSCFLVGCDSAPVHIAALCGVPVLNLSFESVSFWETGPKSQDSRVIRAQDPSGLPSDRVSEHLVSMFNRQSSLSHHYSIQGANKSYREIPVQKPDFEWDLVRCMYMNGPIPPPLRALTCEGIQKIQQANQLAVDELDRFADGSSTQSSLAIIERVDEMFEAIANLVPELNPLVRWYKTEKGRTAPGDLLQILSANRLIHNKLEIFVTTVLNQWQDERSSQDADSRVG